MLQAILSFSTLYSELKYLRVRDITRYIYIFIFKIVEKKKLKVKGEQYEEIGAI